MLTPDQRDRVVVVLVRARNPGNIGATARAMHDFGFHHLRLVGDFPVPLEAAQSAIDASAVLASATHLPTVAEAVADCALVFGTTAVGERTLQHPLSTLAEAVPGMLRQIAQPGAGGRVALLFGSEKTGLSNDEISHCNALLTIPMETYAELRHPSMNLGQAVAVCLYELVRAPVPEIRQAPGQQPRAAETDRLLHLLDEVLDSTGYREHHPANSDLAAMRRLVLRMNLSAADLPVWMGILRQILWKTRSAAAEAP